MAGRRGKHWCWQVVLSAQIDALASALTGGVREDVQHSLLESHNRLAALTSSLDSKVQQFTNTVYTELRDHIAEQLEKHQANTVQNFR